MEASLYAARICGRKFGIVTTSQRSSILHDMSVRQYGFQDVSVGTTATVGVLELDGKAGYEKMGMAARDLQKRGADCICLGCAGMTGLKSACQNAVGQEVMVINGVAVGVHFLLGLVREGLRTVQS